MMSFLSHALCAIVGAWIGGGVVCCIVINRRSERDDQDEGVAVQRTGSDSK